MSALRSSVVAALVGALLVGAVLTGPPAQAESQLQVSADARTWSADLGSPMFDPAVRWIPGDVRSGTFYVRNQAADDGTLAVEVRVVDGDALVREDDVALAVRRDGGSWASLPADGRRHRLSTPDLGSGESARIDVRAAFAPGSPNRSQASRLGLDFRVVLVEAGDVAGPVDDGGPGGLLPDTGGVLRQVLLAGVFSMVAGFAIVVAGTRSRRTERPTTTQDPP